MNTQHRITPLRHRALIGALVFALLLLAGLSSARASEIVPSVGISHAKDGGDNKTFVALEMRTSLAPMVQLGLGAGYRHEPLMNGAVDMKMIPLTASVWVKPVPMLYVGGGAGAYLSLYSYENQLLVPDKSATKFGAHAGGGLSLPLAPLVALDLQSRYVFLGETDPSLLAGSGSADFWSASAGIALKF